MSIVIEGANTQTLMEVRSSRDIKGLKQLTTTLESTVNSVVKEWARNQQPQSEQQVEINYTNCD